MLTVLFELFPMNRDNQPSDVPNENDSVIAAESTQDSDPPRTRNPWDDDDDHFPRTPIDPDRALTMRLLRPSVIALAVCTGVIFISAVASNNAIASSPLENASLAMHRFGMFGLLLSFFGILISYRLPGIAKSLDITDRRKQGNPNRQIKLVTVGLRRLFLMNVVIIAVVWLTAFSAMMIPMVLLQMAAIASLGLLGNLAILHRGLLQAYAIGTLLPLLVVLLNWQSMSMASFGALGMMSPQRNLSFFSGTFATLVTVALIAGLISAAFYTINAQLQQMQGPRPIDKELP